MNFSVNHPINLINLAGLILDFWGVLLLFHYGLPSRIKMTIQVIAANPVKDVEKVKRENARIERLAYRGIKLIGAGFAFQLLGTLFHLSFDIFGK